MFRSGMNGLMKTAIWVPSMVTNGVTFRRWATKSTAVFAPVKSIKSLIWLKISAKAPTAAA